MKLLSVPAWQDYELIDTGNYEKLERFGKYILARPEPQALWNKTLDNAEWNSMAHAVFRRDSALRQEDKGNWQISKQMPQQWQIQYDHSDLHIKMRLGLTGFKHVGIFPEQSNNWNFIFQSIEGLKIKQPKVLNLFAYTGGASLAAQAAGADTTHVDSIKQVVTWANENMTLSGLSDIRWVVEDAMKFVKREVKRGKKYNGILLDPPAYGRGTNGEMWKLEDSINELVQLCAELLEPQQSFLVMNLYSLGFSALMADNLVNDHFKKTSFKEYGELCIPDRFDKKLPLGVFVRFRT